MAEVHSLRTPKFPVDSMKKLKSISGRESQGSFKVAMAAKAFFFIAALVENRRSKNGTKLVEFQK